jgi:hypothetical protein
MTPFYRQPATDLDQKELIDRAIRSRKKPLQRLTVVNKDAALEYFDRLGRLFQVKSTERVDYNHGFVDFTIGRKV